MCIKDNKGYIFVEMMMVVLVVGILVSIGIPIYTRQIEKSREAADLANVRAAYAEVMIPVISNDFNSEYYNSIDKTFEKSVDLIQKKDGWLFLDDLNIGGITQDDSKHWFGEPNDSKKCRVIYSTVNSEAYIVWDEYIYKIGYVYSLKDGTLTKDKLDSNNTYTLVDTYKINNGYSYINIGSILDKNLIKNLEEYNYELEYFIVMGDGKTIEESDSILMNKDNQVIEISSNKLLNGEEAKLVLQLKKTKIGTLDLSECELTKSEVKALTKLIDVYNNY